MQKPNNICLYRCYTGEKTYNNPTGKSSECICHIGFVNALRESDLSTNDIGKTIEFGKDEKGKLLKYQVIKCKFPECI